MVEEENIAVSNDVSPDFEPLLSQLGREEKFVMMVALLALYGDGEFSEGEITKFREIISKIDFAPRSLIHRDETDENLCLDEKVVWALNFINKNFTGSEVLQEEDVFSLFEQLTKSLDQDIEKDFTDAQSRQDYSNKLKQALIEIAEADGTKSENELKLLATFKKTSQYQITPYKILVVIGLLGAVVYGGYKFFLNDRARENGKMARRRNYTAKSIRGQAGAVFVNNMIAGYQKQKKQEEKAAAAASRRRAREAERERARKAREAERAQVRAEKEAEKKRKEKARLDAKETAVSERLKLEFPKVQWFVSWRSCYRAYCKAGS